MPLKPIATVDSIEARLLEHGAKGFVAKAPKAMEITPGRALLCCGVSRAHRIARALSPSLPPRRMAAWSSWWARSR